MTCYIRGLYLNSGTTASISVKIHFVQSVVRECMIYLWYPPYFLWRLVVSQSCTDINESKIVGLLVLVICFLWEICEVCNMELALCLVSGSMH